jgi:hypothetical protein
MVTNTAQTATTTRGKGVLTGLGDLLRQWVCGLHGHDALLHFEQRRISLQCVSCGYQSPGWDIARPAGRAGASAPPAPRARILRLPLPNERHVA